MKRMNCWLTVIGLLLILGLVQPQAVRAARTGPVVKLEILFMNHGPMQPVIKGIKEILARHPRSVSATWYDFETASGQDFRRQKGLQGHIPLMIFLNGSPTWKLEGRRVTLAGFPDGYGPYQFQGKWSLADLEKLLESLTKAGSKKEKQP